MLCVATTIIAIVLAREAPRDGKLAQLAAVQRTLRQETGNKLSFFTTDQSRNVI
jgi:hypothetical protein